MFGAKKPTPGWNSSLRDIKKDAGNSKPPVWYLSIYKAAVTARTRNFAIENLESRNLHNNFVDRL
jgi:hypothetical protein